MSYAEIPEQARLPVAFRDNIQHAKIIEKLFRKIVRKISSFLDVSLVLRVASLKIIEKLFRKIVRKISSF